ncbi:MAG: hypothetical protein V1772_00065, partial [Chloroflexota bacterium]
MSTSEFALESEPIEAPRRVVEAEIKMPQFDKVRLPDVDLAPVRTAAEQVLITGLGVGILVARGVAAAVRAAHKAGAEAADEPGSFSQAVVGLVRGAPRGAPAATTRLAV